MMMSATQDFMDMSAGAGSGSSGGKAQVGGRFEDSLASAAKQSTASKGANVSGGAAKVQHAASESTVAGAAEVVAVEEISAASVALDSDLLRAMLSQLNAAGEDADISAMIEEARTKSSQTSRFDPDAILEAMTAAHDSGEDVEQISDEDLESDITAGQLLAAMASLQADEMDEDAPAIAEDAMLVVGEDESGEIAVKSILPEQIEDLQGDDAAEDASGGELNDTAGSRSIKESARADAAPAKDLDADASPRSAQADMHERAGAERSEVRALDGDKRDPDDARTIDERLAEIVSEMREKRESMASEDKASMVNRRPQVSSRTPQSSTRTAAAAVRKAADAPSSASMVHDAQSREIPSFETLASRLRAADDALSMTESETPVRVGMTYMLDREDAFGDGLTNVLEFMRTDGTPEARVIVDPPALGHIDISIRAAEGGVQATFRVDSDHLKQMVQQQIDILRSSLEDQGIHVSTIAVDIRNKDEQSGKGASHARGGKNKRSVAGVDGDDAEETTQSLVRLDLERGTLHWVA